MKKIIVPIGNALGLFASAGVILKYMYMILVYPFISKELTSLTWFGVFILVLSIEVFILNYNYFSIQNYNIELVFLFLH